MGRKRPSFPAGKTSKGNVGNTLQALQSAKARLLLAERAARNAANRVARPSFSKPIATRYIGPGGQAWRRPDAVLPVVADILAAVSDGQDRTILSWPRRVCDGTVAAAFALRESRATGSLAYCSLAVWPWRPQEGTSHGSMAPVRNVWVHPEDVCEVGRRVATDHQGTRADWTTEGGFAHQATAMIELRMNDLIKGARATLSAADSHANSPTLREITPAFSPVLIPGRTPTYAANPAQIISRVQHYTQARKSKDGLNLSHDLPKMGDPDVTPQAIFGLPWTLKKGVLRELLQFPRFGRVGLDAVIINLTGSERDLHRDDWEKALELLLEELPSAPGRRPPLILLCDDPYMHRRAEGLIKQASGKINRKFPSKLGIYAPLHMPVGDAVELPTVLAPLRVQADFKDPGLASLRAELLALANLHGGSGDREMARVTRKALDVLARTASLPLGLEEALAIAKVYYEEDTDENMRALALFLPGQDFQRMVAAATMIGRSIEQATNLRDHLQSRLASWQQDTPVSAKLWSLLANPKWNNADTAVAIGDPQIAEVFQLATRAVELRVRTISHHDLDRLTKSKRLIVLSPTPNSIHALLTMPHPLDDVVVIGDCAGVGKLSRLLKTLSELPSLGPIAARATALAKVFEIGGAYERLDEAEAKFRLGPDPSKELLDFSRGTGLNGGDVVVITTRGGDVIYHRKQAQVPVYLPDDIRPFKRVLAHTIQQGDQIPVFRKGLVSLLRSAIVSSSRTAKSIAGYHTFIAGMRETIPGSDLSEKAWTVLRRMQAADPSFKTSEHSNVRRWLRADQQALAQESERTIRPEAARDWKRFLLFITALGADEATARIFWTAMIVPTRSFSVQEGALFHDHLSAFLVDPEGAMSSISKGHSASDVMEAIRDAVDVVNSVKIRKDISP
jgi:hypothetical protein